jgi:dCMP deaminase
MKIAFEVATRSTCLRRHVGAVIVREKRILATGYNGAPRGLAHCEDTGCVRQQQQVPSGQRHELCRGLHAEMNVLIQAARFGINIEGGHLYCTNHPCILCAKMLANSAVEEVICADDYPDEEAKKVLAAAGVKTRLVKVGGMIKD